MSDPGNNGTIPGGNPDSAIQYHKKDLWKEENANFGRPHYRLEKAARIVNKTARGKRSALLDVACGPATLSRLLAPSIEYWGIDIAIQAPAPNLLETDLLENPIRFGDKRFDIVLAQGFFEYAGDFQSQKFAEIAQLLNESGIFIVSYVNFGHRERNIYWLYNNIQPLDNFRESLARHFKIRRSFPTSHNWKHTEPNRKLVKTINMHFNANIPFISPIFAVEYFFICSRYLSQEVLASGGVG
jgi:SAM-dependent methyltransferase